MIEQNSRRTKIVKSFEGNALTPAEAENAAKQEIDVIRLVYAPKSVKAIREFIKTVKGLRTAENCLPVMLDVSSWTQGTIHGLKEAKEVAFGDKVVLVPAGKSTEAGAFQVKSDMWERLFAADAKVFVGSGNVVLKVTTARPDRVELEATQGGTIFPEMEVAVPETRRDPDRLKVTVEELKELLEEGTDYLVISGQWSPAQIREFRDKLQKSYGDKASWLIVKVDSGEVFERLPTLMAEVDGVLISRREMSLTINPATIPMVTKEIIQLCNDQAKVVVTASEMLASMRRNATPTRAEVSDVANAVLDGTDAVVVSEEVANGKYGMQAVQVMHRIIRDIEERVHVRPNWIKHSPKVESEMDAIAYNAYRTAERIKAKAIVTITKAGNTALKLASYRAPVPIIAVTFSENALRRLSIVRGVETLLLDIDPNLDEVLPLVNDHLVRSSWLKAGDPIIFVAITLSPVGRESSNLFTIQNLT